jgi:hypothetical protein
VTPTTLPRNHRAHDHVQQDPTSVMSPVARHPRRGQKPKNRGRHPGSRHNSTALKKERLLDTPDRTDSRLKLAPTSPSTAPAGGRAGQLIDAYWRVTHLRHELAQPGDADREIATALAALDAVSLALTGAAMNALERETGHLFRPTDHEADRC